MFSSELLVRKGVRVGDVLGTQGFGSHGGEGQRQLDIGVSENEEWCRKRRKTRNGVFDLDKGNTRSIKTFGHSEP